MSMMNRKNYAVIAAAIAAEYNRPYSDRPFVARDVVDQVALRIADALGSDDPQFNRYGFLRAARGES